jgi:hypothetical protein
MPDSHLDKELNKYWSLLSAEQKRSVTEVITAFSISSEMNNRLQEPDAIYTSKDESRWLQLLRQLSYEQKEALIILIESFGIEIPGQRISIEQYNKELEEAEAAIEKGGAVTHEEMIAMAKKWIHG